MSSHGLDGIVIEHRPGSVRGTSSFLARRVPPRLYGAHGRSIGTDDRPWPDPEEDEARSLDVKATSDGTVRAFDVRTLAEDAGLPESEPCDALVRAIVRRAGTGDVIRFRDGRFLLRDLHVIETALVVAGEDSMLDFGESGGIHFRGSHYNGADPPVTVRAAGPVERGERAVAVGCFGVEITDPDIRDASEHAIATHGDSTTAGGIRLDGGTVEAETNASGAHPGGCLSFSNACEAAAVRGTIIRPARTAISSNAWRLDVSDVVVKSAEDEPDGTDERGRCGDGTPVVSGVTIDSARPVRGASFVRHDPPIRPM